MSSKDKNNKNETNNKKEGMLLAEKEFYVLEITNLNRTIARLRSLCADLENENEECKKRYKTLDQDRSDVIAYLKRSLAQKQEEINELTNRLEAINKEKKTDITKYENKIQEMDRQYNEMNNTLTAEITLLNGKINALEEYKIHKECLTKKYLTLEEKLKEEAERHLEQETVIENQSLIQIDSLRMDIEKRLLNLSISLQKDTQYRIAETTQNIVRENIALNNELNLIIASWQKLFDQNESLKSKLKALSNEVDVSFQSKDEILKKHIIQKQVLDRLLIKHEDMLSKFNMLMSCEFKNSLLKKQIKETNKQKDEAMTKYKNMEILQHSLKIRLAELENAFDILKSHNFKLEERIKEAVTVIKEVIGLGEKRLKDPFWISEVDEYNTRINLLNTLIKLFADTSLFLSEEAYSTDKSHESIIANEWRVEEVPQLYCPSEPSISV